MIKAVNLSPGAALGSPVKLFKSAQHSAGGIADTVSEIIAHITESLGHNPGGVGEIKHFAAGL